ncbi:MAG: hypothetical protein Q8M19_23050 [Reyranella sp.]|nr:hypothetical protein [Reyranella sp.]
MKARLRAFVAGESGKRDYETLLSLTRIGFTAPVQEFWSPGLTGPGIVGAIYLIVGPTALSLMPLNFAGVALLVAGLAMMVVEAFTPGVGVLGLGGIAAFVFGGLFLFDPAGADIARERLETAPASRLENDGNSGSHTADSHAPYALGILCGIQM